ncbi:MAG: hypothetical protein ACLTGI_08850 [Hoylesella buccalis]
MEWACPTSHRCYYRHGEGARVSARCQTRHGAAVVICPGGGYAHLAWENEGTNWASFFNDMGIAAIVLKYRMPMA